MKQTMYKSVTLLCEMYRPDINYRVKLYEGRKESYNVRPLVGSLNPDEIRAFYRGEV